MLVKLIKLCRPCGSIKPMSSFSRDVTAGDRHCTICNSCRNFAQTRVRLTNRDYLHEIKTSLGCTDCGYNDHPEALEFDHLPQYKKVLNLAAACNYSRKRIDAEIAKCEVVCANCHRIRTANRRKAKP